jgi:hypothetical protein
MNFFLAGVQFHNHLHPSLILNLLKINKGGVLPTLLDSSQTPAEKLLKMAKAIDEKVSGGNEWASLSDKFVMIEVNVKIPSKSAKHALEFVSKGKPYTALSVLLVSGNGVFPIFFNAFVSCRVFFKVKQKKKKNKNKKNKNIKK